MMVQSIQTRFWGIHFSEYNTGTKKEQGTIQCSVSTPLYHPNHYTTGELALGTSPSKNHSTILLIQDSHPISYKYYHKDNVTFKNIFVSGCTLPVI